MVILASTKDSKDSVEIYYQISKRLRDNNTDSAMYYANYAKEIAIKTNFEYGLVNSYNMLGILYSIQGKKEDGLNNFKMAMAVAEKSNDEEGLASVYNNLGMYYQILGAYAESSAYYLKSKLIAEKINDMRLLAFYHTNMGDLLNSIGEYDSALVHHHQSIKINSQLGHKDILAGTYCCIGAIKIELEEYDEAETYYRKAMELYKILNSEWGLAHAYKNIGLIHFYNNQVEKSLINLGNAREIFIKLKDRRSVASILELLGKIYMKKGVYHLARNFLTRSYEMFLDIGDKTGQITSIKELALYNQKINQIDLAITQGKQSLQWAQENGDLANSVKALDLLYQIYGEHGNNKMSFKYAQQYIELKDSLFNIEKIENIAKLESKQKMTLIQKENEILSSENNLKEIELQASSLRLKQQKVVQYALTICLIFAIIISIFSYRFYVRKQKTVKLLRKLNREITSQKEQIAKQAQELETVNDEIKCMNKSLEMMVEERTEKIISQNKKLQAYAFSNAHEVRAPLANLLGLVQVSKLNGNTLEEQEEIINKIYTSALDLDKVISKVNSLLVEEHI